MGISGSILGTRVQRIEDPRLLRTGGSYVADLDLPGVAAVVYARSALAHARLTRIDVSAARAAPGVIDVVTASDLPFPPIPAPAQMPAGMARPLLASATARFVGEPIVAVVAETQALATDAAEAVIVDYEPLPALVDPEVARQNNVLLCEAASTNIAVDTSGQLPGDLFDECEVVVEARLVNNRMAAVPLECRVAAASWQGDQLTYWAACQRAHPLQATLSAMFNINPSDVRVVVADVGGSFGAKHGNTPEELLVPFLARRVGRPVRFAENRSENMTNLYHGRAQIQYAALGGTRDGRLLAYRLHVVRDAGAYPGIGAFTQMTRLLAPGCYAIPRVGFGVTSVLTNTSPTGAFRGAGRPEAAAAIERMIELYAHEIGLDSLELRRRNYVRVFPHSSPMGVSYDSGDYATALDRALTAASYAELRAEQARRIAEGGGRLLGIGLSSYVEVANPLGSGEYGAIGIARDGSAVVRTGSSPHGQGLHTSLAMIASDITGIPLADITVVHGDTAVVPRGNGTGGSRSLQTAGPAVQHVARDVVSQACQVAAELLEANTHDVVLDRREARFHVAGTPARSVTWAQVAQASPCPLTAEHDYVPLQATFPFGCHIAVVEVDIETGRVEVVRFVAVDDAGTILNPMILEGQIHGGVAAGISQALYEHVRFDSDGNPLTASLADYAVVTAAELPSFDVVEMATPTPVNPLGAKGIGESGTTGATPAVQNAVIDALSHLGVRHVDLPLTPEKVWRTINSTTK